MIEFTPTAIDCRRGYYVDATGIVRHAAKPSKMLAVIVVGDAAAFERIVEMLAARWHVSHRAMARRGAYDS